MAHIYICKQTQNIRENKSWRAEKKIGAFAPYTTVFALHKKCTTTSSKPVLPTISLL